MDTFRKHNDTRPTKRQRMNTDVPEGFLTSTITNFRSKAVHKPLVPSFSSAFGERDQPPPLKRKQPLFDHTTAKKPLSLRLPQAYDPFASKENVEGRANASDLSRPQPRKVISVKEIYNGITLEASTKPLDYPILRPVSRVAPPPPLASSSKVPMKRIAAPVFPLAKPPSKVLVPIQPPSNIIVPGRKLPPKEDMCTISTIGLGRLMDLSSESGIDELASLLLQDQHPELNAKAEGVDPCMRGLELSPDRKGKGKASKFTRGGLAARASAHFDQTRTAFILWRRQKEMDQQQRAHALPSGADIAATVIKTLFTPVKSSTGRTGDSTSLVALCRIRQVNGNDHASFKASHLYRVAFTFMDTKTESQRLADGDVVRIFKPWNEMSTLESKIGDKPARRLPATLPLPSSTPFSTPDPLDAPIHDTIVFCTRFMCVTCIS